MTTFLRKKVLVVLTLFGTFMSIYGQNNFSHTSGYSQVVYFRFDQTDIDPAYMGNRHALLFLDSLFSDPVRVFSIDSIHLYAYSSPEGREAYNIRLAERRLEAMDKWLTNRYPLLPLQSRIFRMSGGENWDGLRELVTQDKNFDEREEVLMILDCVKEPDRRENLIKSLNGGMAYKYIEKHILPLLRHAMGCIIWTNTRYADRHSPSLPVVSPTDAHSLVLESPNTSDYGLRTSAPTPHARYSALKTNLAAWAMTGVNLAYEMQMGVHFSLDLPLMWSSWDVSSRHALRIIAFQPEVRYWFARPGCGHFFGLHAHAARYNLKWGDTRYQDNECPLLGAGLGYGYALSFNRTWGMEFNIGAGYAYGGYHLFRNVPNGALFDTGTLRHWGITRLGVSFIYKFPRP